MFGKDICVNDMYITNGYMSFLSIILQVKIIIHNVIISKDTLRKERVHAREAQESRGGQRSNLTHSCGKDVRTHIKIVFYFLYVYERDREKVRDEIKGHFQPLMRGVCRWGKNIHVK